MPRMLTGMMTLLLVGGVCAIVRAQHPGSLVTTERPPCSSCHTCDNPMPGSLCLRACIRGAAWEEAEKRAPDLVILNELEALYLPVPFDHRGHAEMAEMTQGCVVCHHHTPEGAEHPACKSCHEVSPVREDMRKPSLKAAYHRQCLSCHREWSHETACGVCHPPKAGLGGRNPRMGIPSKDDIIGTMHPPIPEPDVEIYETKHLFRAGTNVVFRHKEHIHRFGFRCVECHREDNCLRCHEEGREHTQEVKTLEEHHNPCVTCHDVVDPEKCGHCHYEEGKPEPPRFDHANTGWPLDRYHKQKGCRDCHVAVRFVKLDRECNSCHSDWEPDSFDHAVTGQLLDSNHEDIDCADCHADRKFDSPPRCDECHEEEEGIVYPAKRPGPLTGAGARESD
jgi:hypothetical protein